MAVQVETGDSLEDPEKIGILSATVARGSLNNPTNCQQLREETTCQDQEPCISSVSNGSFQRNNSEVFYSKDNSFYNMGFTLSPSDLERSWRQTRLGMTDRTSRDGIRSSNSEGRISIHRHPIDNSYIEKKFGPLPTESSYQKTRKYINSHCACSMTCILSFFASFFPILTWLPKYKREYLLPDIIAGFTISILHIPQGMAYGVLASVKAENGLYVSFFPILIYVLLGTSRHISIGTFAVISLMLSNAVYKAGASDYKGIKPNQTVHNETYSGIGSSSPPTSLEVVTTLALSVGFLQIAMSVFQLGALSVVLSDQLVSGFSTGAACHVATSQIKDLFGVSMGQYGGPLQLIYSLRDLCENLVDTNVATLIISIIAIFILALFKEQVDGRLKGRLKMPIPIDLIVVVIATTVSYLMNLHSKYRVSIIKDIPTGLPYPVPPRLNLIFALIGDSIAIAVVAFAISLSMAKLLSKKHKYDIYPNQELLALGCANVFSSFFACYPCAASLSRSLVQERAGGKTQIAGLVSCGILLVILLALAPMFYSLPKSILSCIVLVALKPMFVQVKDFWRAWHISKLDGLIWFVTFISTILLDVTYGLIVGVIFSLVSVIARTVSPSRTFLGRIPNSDIYLDMKRYDLAQEIKGVKIFHFENALYFINRELFKSYLLKHVPLKARNFEDDIIKEEEKVHRIIIDCSTFSFIDMAGLETLLEVMKEYQELGISVFLAGCSVAMQDLMARAKFYEQVPMYPSIFPTIHDAVEFQYFSHMSGSS